ncbi:MAG: hypothetical protein LRY55_10485, partial [Leadbetterella sp.]|nr:hypothetical protein [Leadbetterella sp.]
TPTGMTSACTGGTDVPVTDGASSIYTTAGTGRPTTTGTYYLHMCAIDQAGVGSSYRLTRLMDTTAPTMPTPVCAYRFEAGYDAYVYYYSIGADAHSGLASGNLSSDLGSMSTTTVWASGTYAGRLRAMKVGTLTLDTAQMISSVSMLDAVGNTYSGGTSTWSITCSACVTGTTCP